MSTEYDSQICQVFDIHVLYSQIICERQDPQLRMSSWGFGLCDSQYEAKNILWSLTFHLKLMFALVLIFVLLLINALLSERQSR
ncbi:MAG: hypothetical protein C6Y22_17130 [Hapalosiphonaceae cyanobacterium JJU2]|nr:MAG: hypothetical protein C6Y22_17130 [Hapalosiphonaceae cyanobacterium JJU2]